MIILRYLITKVNIRLWLRTCYSGDIFTESDYGIIETWVFIPERGSIGFFANADLGVPT